MMDVNFGWIFVFILFFNRISITCIDTLSGSGFDKKFGKFKVLHPHPMIRRCANAALETNKFVGARVSESTGKCEGLSHSWGINQTIQSGYAYAKKTFVQEIFQPPIRQSSSLVGWIIPGIFDEGAQVDVDITMPANRTFSVSLCNTMETFTRWEGHLCIHVSLEIESREIVMDEFNGSSWTSTQAFAMPPHIKPGENCKVSCKTRGTSFEIRLCGAWTHWLSPSMPVASLQQVVIVTSFDEKSPLLIHSFTFTARA